MAPKLRKRLTETTASPEKVAPHLQGDWLFPTECRQDAPVNKALARFPGCSGWEQSSLHPLQWDLLYKMPICYPQPAGFLLSSVPRLHQHPLVLSFACMSHRHRPPKFALDLLARSKSSIACTCGAEQLPLPSPSSPQGALPWSCAWCTGVFSSRVRSKYAILKGFLQSDGS